MIILSVKEYCHTCPKFEPYVEKLYSHGVPEVMYVCCENSAACASIAAEIRKQITKEEK